MPLPASPAARDAYLLDAVRAGRFTHAWAPLTIKERGHTLTLHVSSEPLRVDGVLFGAGARLAQQIADLMNARLVTPKIKDAMYGAAALTIEPQPMGKDDLETGTMLAHTAKVDQAIARAGGRPRSGILSSLEKGFVLSNQASATHGVNYGWFLPASVGRNWKGVSVYPSVTLDFAVIQQPSTFHGLDQDDYASGVVLVRKDAVLDGSPLSLDTILQDPSLAPLVSHEGPLHVLRQPGVEELSPSPAAVRRSGGGALGRVLGEVLGGGGGKGPGAGTVIGMAVGAFFAGMPGVMMGGALGYVVDRLRQKR